MGVLLEAGFDVEKVCDFVGGNEAPHAELHLREEQLKLVAHRFFRILRIYMRKREDKEKGVRRRPRRIPTCKLHDESACSRRGSGSGCSCSKSRQDSNNTH